MRITKEIILIGIFTALLISGQVALAAVSGAEIVTVMVLSFAYFFGIKRAMSAVTAFSFLRCILFGFFPNVLILYLVYFNLFALAIGIMGRKFGRKLDIKKHVALIAAAAVMTLCFTLLDNVITPLFYGYTAEAAKAYFFASFYAAVPQTVCAAATTAVFLKPLLRVYSAVYPF